MLSLRIAGAFEFGSLALHGPRIWKFGAFYGVLFLLTGLFEDFLMRGYSQWVLSTRTAFLAGGSPLIDCLRLHPRRQLRRISGRTYRYRPDRVFSMSHTPADRRFVVGRRFSHGLGLGRELPVLRSR
jgi:hypothetical protein